MSRIGFAIAAALAVGLMTNTAATAGTYGVLACGDAPGGANNSWSVSNNAPTKLSARDRCQEHPSAGLDVRDVLGVSNAPADAHAEWTFLAPVGTSIVGVSYNRWLYKEDDDDWQPAVSADGASVDSCSIVYPAVRCSAGGEGGQRTTRSFTGANTLAIGVRCGAPSPVTCSNGGTLQAAIATLYGATVTLTDPTTPALTNLGGSLLAGGYLTGTKSVTFDATDNAGIRTARLYVDGAAPQDTPYVCDFTYPIPCSKTVSPRLALDTTSLSDGAHTVRVAAVDAAGNETKSASQSILVDNRAPAVPSGLAVDGGSDWRSVNSFSVSWTNPTDAGSAVAVAHYALCAADGSGCQAPRQLAGSDVSRIDNISVPSQGEWLLRVWLEDAAGNVNAANFSTATLRYGSPPTAPARPEPPAPTPTNPPSESPLPDVTTTLTTPPAQQTTTLRRNLGLRLTSARLSRGRLYVRGRLARTTRTRLVFSVRTKAGHLVRRAFTTRTRRFAVELKVRDTRGRLTVRFAGDATFAPATAVIKPRR